MTTRKLSTTLGVAFAWLTLLGTAHAQDDTTDPPAEPSGNEAESAAAGDDDANEEPAEATGDDASEEPAEATGDDAPAMPVEAPPEDADADVFVPRSPPPPTCARSAHDAAANAVVRVRTGGNWGAGFVYGSPRQVVTSWSLMALGRPVTVVARDGTHLSAQLLGHDAQYDIAVLQLTEDVPDATPLSPAPETSAEIGLPVVAIGHPFGGVNTLLGERGDGLLRWSVSQGTIGAVNETAIQADVALTVGHAGSPLLDCGGRVLGVVAGTGLLSADLGLVARIGQVDAVVATASGPGDFLGDMRLRLGIGVGLVIDEDGRTAAGFDITLGAVLFDRISWMNRVGFFMGGIDGPSSTELEVSRNLLRVESLLGYRFFLDIGGFTTVYLVPAVGATISFQTVRRSTASVVPAPAPCTPSDTESCVVPSVTRTTDETWLVRPAIGFLVMLGENFEIGYTLELGLDTAEEQAGAAARGVTVDEVETYHTVRIGLLF